jgi:hypothetical protein
MAIGSFSAHLRSGIRSIRQTETILMNSGRLLINSQISLESTDLSDYEFKIFSQWGEDGILQYLTRNLEIDENSFIEFGVEDFFESNCRFLMMKDHWKGFVIDGSRKNIDAICSSYYFFQYQLETCESFITRENIGELLERSGFSKNVGIISVDIDGVDYHIFESLAEWNPAIFIFEYNSVFGKESAVTVPYDPQFVRRQKHWSNQYWGASLAAFDYLARLRGYSIVGVNSAGSNAFFVRNDLLNDRVKATSVAECFRPMSFRDSRDKAGNLTYKSGLEQRALIAHLPLVDVKTGSTLLVADLGS